MSALEIAAATTLGLQLLDAKYHVSDDLLFIQKIARVIIPYSYNVYKKRASFWYAFEKSANKYPSKEAVSFPRPKRSVPLKKDSSGFPIYDEQFSIESYTYKELYDMVLRLSHILRNDYGVTSEHTIGIDCMNKPLFIVMWMALWNIGALPAFLNYNIKGKPLIHCIKTAGISQVFVDPDCADAIKESEHSLHEQLPEVKVNYMNETQLFTVISTHSSPRYRAPNVTRRPNDTDSSCCALIYTSGTTGLPKPAILSWKKAFMAGAFFGTVMKIDKNSVVMTAMPLYHSTAAMLGVCPALASGACVSVCQKFSASTFWTQAKLVKATHVQYVGEVCRYLLNANDHPDQRNHNVKIAYGNGLRRDIWKDFKSRFNIEGVGEFYASTESPIATTSLQFGDYGVGACRKYGSLINTILSFAQAIVKMNPDDESEIWRDPSTGFCVRANTNDSGELLMKIVNPNNIEGTFQGYYGNLKATSSKIIRNVFKKGDAWFRSGDLLRMDEDGLMYFVDRLGDTFRWKSENVSATEVENELMGSGAIKQSVVVGVQVPKHEGRAGFAVVDPKDGLSDQEVLDKIYQHVSRNLPKYAIPQFVKVGSQYIQASHNHKVPKNQFKSQKLPNGENGNELIYWLNKTRYEELTESSWTRIMSGASKL
ncbi:acetyl-CoA synthetase-like protein [Metschnikowia bicuspidata var. bicuspidata NRRL YB-4993]|uniref:Very long-chain fatty acid transport protein n=1 Tax=Metschnikowia bicuspidata var. bicuspidata NRRL YB-4993 TaxID=869754 RepID=A0A1A0HD01_9ASCO|nr:acetyl-CoA synthetase-like protein [Metschnikowia bicuspidata var. bicuspidata NRRL YB-4993]OBA21757.1 acetyl-CoA synthetase-like protein [Metschnikowia bicuspidata var. bicuspidata NRRL YB-4993]